MFMYDLNKINVGEQLKKYRKAKHFSLQYIGDRIYKSKATISKYEKGEIVPDLNTVLDICNVLDIDLQTIIPSFSPAYNSKYPFTTDTLYLYYLKGKKLICSTLEIKPNINNKSLVYFYNGINNSNSSFDYYYEGNFDYAERVVYMNLNNIGSDMLKAEQVQIIVYLNSSKNNNFFHCFITGLTPTLIPIVKKGLISTSAVSNKDDLINILKLSKDDLHQIKQNNSWLLQNI